MIPNPERQPPLARILFIEDARDLALVVVRELEAAGYQVTHNLDGETGLRQAETNDFQLVILDWMLPGMDGLNVLRRLRTFSVRPGADAHRP